MQAFDPRQIHLPSGRAFAVQRQRRLRDSYRGLPPIGHLQGPGAPPGRGPSALQKRADRLRRDAPRCTAARMEGRPHGMPSPALQTAASSRQATYFPTTAERLRAAINP